MILSHAHRFIYIKTYKTASTSVEAALSGICGADDVITEASEQLRGVRQQAARNYRIEHPEKPRRALWKRLTLRPERHYHPSVGYYEHMPASRVRAYCGEAVWNSYYKFSFERNPWDRQLSWYRYKTKSKATPPSFETFNRNRKRAHVENWELYTIEDRICLDFIGRYESLEADFATVLAAIGLTGKVELPTTNVSKGKTGDYRSSYDAASRAMIGEWYAREIAHFGYQF